MLGCQFNSGQLIFVNLLNLLFMQMAIMVRCDKTFEYLTNGAQVDNISLRLDFFPKSVTNLLVHSVAVVHWNYSSPNELMSLQSNYQWIYTVTYVSDNIKVAKPIQVQLNGNHTMMATLDQKATKKYLVHNGINLFGISAEGTGRTKIKIKLLREDHTISTTSLYANISSNSSNAPESVTTTSSVTELLRETEYSVTVIREFRLVDDVFRWVVAVTGVITIFAVGCVTDSGLLLGQLKKPGGIIITIVCKAVLLPPLSFAISRAFHLDRDISLGLLYTSTVPSGGLGFFLTCASKGDKELALALHFIIAFLSMGSLPLWIYVLGSLTESSKVLLDVIQWFSIWLASTLAALLLGLTLRLCHQKTAEQLLEWLIKPTLLLFCLVYITIGMYINSYAFVLLDTMSTVAITLLPCCAFLIAQILGYLFQQERKSRKAIGCEITTFNGLVLLGMIHFTLPKLEADLAAIVPLLVMLVTPIPFVFWYFGHKLKVLFSDKYNNNNLNSMKNMERSRKNSIASSLINDTNVTNLSSSQSPQTPGSPIEETVDTGENDAFVDQITVL